MKVSALLALTVVVFLVSNLAGSVEFSGNIGNETVNKTISVEKVYFPGDKVILKANFMPLKAKLVDPAGKVIGLEFRKSEGGFEAELELKKDVVLGKYLLFADNVSAEFYVDSYSIEAAYFNGKVVGNVSYYFAEPEYVYYKAGKEEGKAKVAEDGSFEILLKKAAKEVELRCGNAVERVKLKAELSIVLDRVEVVNETAFVEGRVLLNGVETEANLSYWFDEGEERVLEVNGTFNLSFSNVSGILHLIAENNGLRAEESVEIEAIKKVVEVGGVYFAGDTVEVVTNFKPKKGLIVGPDGKKEELEFVEEDGKYLARYELKKDVVLGNYTVLVDGIVKQFVVDFCEVSAEFGDGAIWGEARSFYTTPKVRYLIAGENFSEEGVAGGNFNIPVNRTGDFRAVFECGNSRYEMNFSVAEARNVEVDDFSFLGEIVEVRATFMPEEAYIVTPSNETVRLNFSEREGAFIAEIGAEEIGRYNLRVDEFNLSFVVDDYSINASFNGSAVAGTIKWHFVKPDYVYYKAGKEEGKAKVADDGSFEILLKKAAKEVELRCGNVLKIVKVTPKPPKEEKGEIVAFDPVKKVIVIKKLEEEQDGKFKIASTEERKKKVKLVELEVPATEENIKKFNLTPDVLSTEIKTKRVKKDMIRLEVNNKLETWYRFSVEIPEGYRVKGIIGDDGRRIVNTVHVNRSTGELEGDLRWYVKNNTLYFYDDPIWGYDISLYPPRPNRSIAVELAYSGPYSEGGQISAIIFPYSEGDDDATITSYDHAGRTEDYGYAYDLDIDAGSKIAIRFSSGGNTREFGNWWDHLNGAEPLGDDLINQISREDTPLNTAPNGVVESVITTKMQTPLWQNSQVNITQKVIIRDNSRWFATIYYIENIGSTTITNLRFFQGMDWNFNGDFSDDYGFYNSSVDTVYGYDSNAAPGDIQYGGFSSNIPSSAHDVGNYYSDIWTGIDQDNLQNRNSYYRDAGVALAWDKPSLAPGEMWIVPVIWGLGFTKEDMVAQINDGKSKLYDTGILSIDAPANNSNLNPSQGVVYFNATAALFGIVDAYNLEVIFNITKVGGGYSYQGSKTVNLSVPDAETANVSFPLDISSLGYGTYKVSFRTNLSNDQNTTNDEKWIYVNIVGFTVEPDKPLTANPGEEAFHNLTAINGLSSQRFDVRIEGTSEGWPTAIYVSGVKIAEDADGDSFWDFVDSNYDTNSNGIPDIPIPQGTSYINVSKEIPSSAELGVSDFTQLNFTSTTDASIFDTATIQTSTPPPPTEIKTFYLHGDSVLNTSAESTPSQIQILANSLHSWYQNPVFADNFRIYDNVTVNLWLSSSTSSTHEVRVQVLSTTGTTSYLIGANSTTLTLTTTPTLYTFKIPLTSPFEFRRGDYIVLRVENIASSDMTVSMSQTYSSNITLHTSTYVNVEEIQSVVSGNDVTVYANVTDPIGSYDISEARIEVFYPNGSLLISTTMNLNTTDPSSPSLWKLFDFTFTAPVPGFYRVNVTGVESNGVTSTSTAYVAVGKIVTGRVLEDLFPLGKNNGEDIGLSNVRVALYEDNGNGLLDENDKIVGIDTTNSTGYFRLSPVNVSATYFIVVDSRTLTSFRGLNSGYKVESTWAEQTYQTEWDESSWVVVQKFGGQDPEESDSFGLNFEHYTALNLNNYNGESIDFGFSFEVIVNIEDKKEESLKPIGEVFIVENVGESWKTVYLHNYYESPVIVCTYNLPSSSDPPAVVRIRNVQHYSFEIRIQNPGDSATPTPSDVHCIVMEEGNWTLSDGTKVEAHRVVSDETNRRGSWNSGLEHLTYNWSYANPVVLGQVMSYNDPDWSAFWCSNGTRQNPPDSSNLYVGKHVGEDTDITRNPEVLGVIVVEAGSGVVNGMSYEADLGADSIRGVDDGPPFSYSLGGDYSVAITTQNAMDGGNGGWAVLYGSNPVSNKLNLSIDEDQIRDGERSHGTEQVAYWVFNKSGTLTTKVDSERYCQGCLRQFIANSNAIAGKQRSYFVMAVEPNNKVSDSKWWSITVNSTLGSLPNFNDEVELNGTVLNADMTVNNSNPDCLLYNYSTNTLESVACSKSIPVGVGSDGVPFSGDEPRLNAIPKPEIEIIGVAGSPVLNFTAKAHVSSVSVFSGSNGIEVYGDDSQLDKVFAGLRADGSDPSDSGFPRISSHGIRILSNNTTVNSSIAAYNGGLGIRFEGSGVNSGKAVNSIAYYNALSGSNLDGFIAVNGASNVIFENCVAANNSGSGIDNYNGGRITIRNCSVVKNGWGNAEPSGIRVSGSGSEIVNNLVAENVGDGILVTPTGSTSTPTGIKISRNSIFKNGYVGIDLNVEDTSNNMGDNVTLNDGQLDCSQPNCGIDYPVITAAQLIGSSLHIEGFINDENAGSGSSSFAGATVEIYMVNNSTDGDDLAGNNVLSGGSTSSKFYGEGWIYLGSLTADSSGNFRGELNVAGKGAEVGSLITALTILNGNTSEFGPDARVTTKPVKVRAEMAITFRGANITITALEEANNVKLYWIKPSGLVLTAEGDFDSSGNDGDIYWWEFGSISAGEVRHVNLTFGGDFSLIETFNIGVDPLQ
jgi:hypothetical protein